MYSIGLKIKMFLLLFFKKSLQRVVSSSLLVFFLFIKKKNCTHVKCQRISEFTKKKFWKFKGNIYIISVKIKKIYIFSSRITCKLHSGSNKYLRIEAFLSLFLEYWLQRIVGFPLQEKGVTKLETNFFRFNSPPYTLLLLSSENSIIQFHLRTDVLSGGGGMIRRLGKALCAT